VGGSTHHRRLRREPDWLFGFRLLLAPRFGFIIGGRAANPQFPNGRVSQEFYFLNAASHFIENRRAIGFRRPLARALGLAGI